MAEKLEIEKKFVLKSFPQTKRDKVVKNIEQFYITMDDGRTARIRKTIMNGEPPKYELTFKKKQSPGVYLEDETLITKEQYTEYQKKAKKFLKKKRILIKDDFNLIWEIDLYKNIKLITAEVELTDINYNLQIPGFIQKVLIADVTGIKEFSNSSLAFKIK